MVSMIFYHGGASAKLVAKDAGVCILADVWSIHRGQKQAREVMQKVITYADKYNITITLLAQRYGPPDSNALNNKQLEEFYEKFGFVREPASRPPYHMTRAPSQK